MASDIRHSNNGRVVCTRSGVHRANVVDERRGDYRTVGYMGLSTVVAVLSLDMDDDILALLVIFLLWRVLRLVNGTTVSLDF